MKIRTLLSVIPVLKVCQQNSMSGFKYKNKTISFELIFITFSGNRTFYDENIGISSYGQALSHSIAQYACEESLQSILSRVSFAHFITYAGICFLREMN